MRLIKDVENIAVDDKPLALRIINKLKIGDRVFGNPAEGLKSTLKKKEELLNKIETEQSKNPLQVINGEVDDLIGDIRKLKAGITGEETLAEYMEQIIKYDPELAKGLVFFASLSDPDQNYGNSCSNFGDFDDDLTSYISDSDFIAVYGNSIIILDAKNIVTSPEIPIYLSGNELLAAGGKSILELHPSIHIWERIFRKECCNVDRISGITVIVNKKGATIWRNQEWYSSPVKPIHMSELVQFLHDWIKNNEIEPVTNLSLLIAISKMQILKDKPQEVKNIRNRMERFGI